MAHENGDNKNNEDDKGLFAGLNISSSPKKAGAAAASAPNVSSTQTHVRVEPMRGAPVTDKLLAILGTRKPTYV